MFSTCILQRTVFFYMSSHRDDYLEFEHSVAVPLHIMTSLNASVRRFKYRVESPYTKCGAIQSWEFILGPYTKRGAVINRSLMLYLPPHSLESGCKEII